MAETSEAILMAQKRHRYDAKHPSPQQIYYYELTKNLPAPYNSFEWKFEGFCKFYRRLMRQYWLDFFYEEIGQGPLGEQRQKELDEKWGDFKIAGFVPDGHCIQDDMIYLLEIVETRDIHEEKARLLSEVAWNLDEASYGCSLVMFYPRQGNTAVYPSLIELDILAAKFKGRKSKGRESHYRAALTVGLRAVSPLNA